MINFDSTDHFWNFSQHEQVSQQCHAVADHKLNQFLLYLEEEVKGFDSRVKALEGDNGVSSADDTKRATSGGNI